jgi:RNA polymerase sigma factor (sigma-70 family)
MSRSKLKIAGAGTSHYCRTKPESVGVADCRTNPSPLKSAAAQSSVNNALTPKEPLPKLTPEQQELVRRNVGLVGVHLRTRVPTPRYPMRQREYDDLFQQGCLALVRAAARYRPDRDGTFQSYAIPRIRGTIHNGLFDLFTVVHVPARAIHDDSQNLTGATRRPPGNVQEMTANIEGKMVTEQAGDSGLETIRHAVHRRFELAVRHTLDQMRAKVWRHRDPTAIMVRIAEERLLISDERYRTPLRRIAREAGISSGRSCDYENNLVKAVQAQLERDPQVSLLIEMAREEGAGWDAPLDTQRRQRLIQAEIHEFEERFMALEPPARARIIYSLIEKSSQCMSEVARNLFRLTISADEGGVRTVA